ncbi:MAG: nuclear transport factor 2 family protein [Pseudomonadota bacterium]
MLLAEIPAQIEQAVDRKDWKHARLFFTDQISVDFTSIFGGEPASIPSDALLEGWASNLKGNKESLHMRGAAIIKIDGDNATAVSNGYAWNKLPGAPDGSGELWEVWGVYTHGFVRTNDGWKVNKFKFEMTHERGSEWVKKTPGS